MKIQLVESDLKTLKEENGIYSYSIKTKTGTMLVDGIESVESALRSAERNLVEISKSHLTK